jgi:cardiolipin synthase A/B
MLAELIDDPSILIQIAGVLLILIALAAAGHVILHKRDSRAALLWTGLIFLSPLLGPIFYFLFGINRLRQKAIALKQSQDLSSEGIEEPPQKESNPTPLFQLPEYKPLIELGNQAVKSPLVSGNSITPLFNGDVAYPEMIRAISTAQKSIGFSTFIFDYDTVGREFVQALDDAHQRGVAVRILIDGVGSMYHIPTAAKELRKRKIPVRTFLPPLKFWSFSFVNLRLHRKVLIIDGVTAFCGGMNIREGHRLKPPSKHPILDLQFKISGPVVRQLRHVFFNDWFFTARERLEKEDAWCPSLKVEGKAYARAIPDGPDENFEKIRWMYFGAITEAKESLRIMTPYFLPDFGLTSALSTAALKGVKVQIILPSKNNLPWVHWATQAALNPLLEQGCEIYFSPPPFDHTKLFIMDHKRVQIGSANWDARSLRLNFELDLEAYDNELARSMTQHFEDALAQSKKITLSELKKRSLPIRFRNGIARLFTPFF